MARKKKPSLDEFATEARAQGLSYSRLQVKETIRLQKEAEAKAKAEEEKQKGKK